MTSTNYQKVQYSLKPSTVSVSTDGATQQCADRRHIQLRQQMYVSSRSTHSVQAGLAVHTAPTGCTSRATASVSFNCPVRSIANRLSIWHTYTDRTASNGEASGFYSAGSLFEPRQGYGLSRQVFRCLLQSFWTNAGEAPRTLFSYLLIFIYFPFRAL